MWVALLAAAFLIILSWYAKPRAQTNAPLPSSTSETQATLGYGQIVLQLDNPSGFQQGQTVQVTSTTDQQTAVGTIVAWDPVLFNATINITTPNLQGNVYFSFFVQVLASAGNQVGIHPDLTAVSNTPYNGASSGVVPGTPSTLKMTVSLPGSLVGGSTGNPGTSPTLTAGNVYPFTVPAGLYYPVQGNVQIDDLTPATHDHYNGSVVSYIGTTLNIFINSVFGAATPSATWGIYGVAGPLPAGFTPVSNTSSTPLTFGSGIGQIFVNDIVNMTTGTNALFTPGSAIIVGATTDQTQFFRGNVITYNASTGAIAIRVTDVSPTGSGTISSWSLFAQDAPNTARLLSGAWGGGGGLNIGSLVPGSTFSFSPTQNPLNAVATVVGNLILLYETSNPQNWVWGQIIPGSPNFVVMSVNGSGTITDWTYTVYLSPSNLSLNHTQGMDLVLANITSSLSYDTSGAIPNLKCTTATASQLGCSEPDNSTIKATAGVYATQSTTVAGQTCTPGSTCGLGNANNVLGADVNLNNTGTYFDGPSMAQGTSGTWQVNAKVMVIDTGGSSKIYCKLWDGTNAAIDSGGSFTPGANNFQMIPLTGQVTSPAGNMRVSCKDVDRTTGKILFNQSGNSADSTIWGIRIK